MIELVQWILTEYGVDPGSEWLIYVIGMVAAGVIAVGFVAIFAGPVTVVERRVAGRIMSRIGPNRVGPQGSLQWLADGLKSFLKEDLVPDEADGPLFRIAPYIVFAGMFGTFVVLPFGASLIAADLNIGLLFLMTVTALVVVGLLMAGWGSNSKWALFGGIRSAAQLVSYEIPTAFALLVIVICAGSLSTQEIVRAQGGWPWEWFVTRNPFTFAAFFLFMVAALAEGNRVPFDLPEAESELVAGYCTEYTGMRYLFFMFAEWANLWIMGAIACLAFLGGWQIPGVHHDTIYAATGWEFWGWQALSFVIFMVKTSWIVFIVIQLRWTVPRPRVDQTMNICWKYLVPLSMVAVIGVLALEMMIEPGGLIDTALRLGMTGLSAALVAAFFWRARHYYMADRDKYHGLQGKTPWYPPYRLP